jgi:nucleoside-diphosphate-sugar epimerase
VCSSDLPRPPDDPPILVPDLTRQANELGWRAPTTLADGLALTRGWWIANPPK